MVSSPNSSWISARIQGIDDMHKDIKEYKAQVFKLEELLLGRPDLRVEHPEMAKNAKRQIDKSLDTLEEAEAIIKKAISLNSLMSWVERLKSSGLYSRRFEELKQTMTSDDEEVKRQARRIRGTSRPKGSDEHDQLLREQFHPRIMKIPPFAEPYDEDLCEF